MNEIYVCTCVMRSAASDTEREGHDEKMENPWRGALADLEDDLITSNAVLRAYRWHTQPPRTRTSSEIADDGGEHICQEHQSTRAQQFHLELRYLCHFA